jgi:hypothetical protein
VIPRLDLPNHPLTSHFADEAKSLSKTHQDVALACLHQSNFLEVHQFYAVQAIALLVVTGQDGEFSNLFPTLLTV